tara:strand:- start:402 stop:632 length:231 start_codon:yes stop_codon:yes gene_type:complete
MVADLLRNIVTVSCRRRHIPEGLPGRRNGRCRFFGWGLMSVGALAGAMALRLPYVVAAIVCALLAVCGWMRLRLPP